MSVDIGAFQVLLYLQYAKLCSARFDSSKFKDNFMIIMKRCN